jgi:endogenous inhibitor of DNA gyrase (YacG/DUF329 family)
MTDDQSLQSKLTKWRTASRRRPHRALKADDLEFPSYKITKKTCSRCGRTFFEAADGISYCSTRCQQVDRNETRRETRALKRAERERVRKPQRCKVCGTLLLDQVRTTLRYCSNACRQRAYRRAGTHADQIG